jgi:hypothetical protein
MGQAVGEKDFGASAEGGMRARSTKTRSSTMLPTISSLALHITRYFEMFVVEVIDGRRTLCDLGAAADDPSTHGSLVEQLWWHDQIVFDKSGSVPSRALS